MTTDVVHYQAPLTERIDYSKAIAAATIIPRAFQNRPADVLVAVEYGRALGLEPIVALSEINIISGTPSLSASMMAALARQAGHKVRVTGDAKSATCVIVRADDPDHEHTATWDEKKAKDAGLWGKGHWSKDPGTMLRWRAISECVRFACSEVLGGLKYTPEEVSEFTSNRPSPAPVDAGRARSGTSRLADAVAPASAPEPEPEPAVDPEPEPSEPTITPDQSKKLHATLRDAGAGERDAGLALISSILGRDVDTTKTLTVTEASTVIDALSDAQTLPVEDAS